MWPLNIFAVIVTLSCIAAAYPQSAGIHHRSLLVARSCGPSPVINCEQFSPSGANANEYLCCREYIRGSYPRTIGGRRVDLYRYTQGWDINNETTISHLESLSDALEKVLPVYEGFGVPFDLIVVFSQPPLKVEGDLVDGYEQEKPGATTPCYVRIEDADDITLEQTIAHETYHCVQDSNRNGNAPPADQFNAWFMEGVPEFYAAEFYPFHQDNSWIRKYDGSVPLYNQSYEASLFFVYVHGFGLSYEDINNFVFSEPQAKSFADCRKSLSGNSDFTKAFPSFAQAFSNNLITYSDGSLVDPVTSPGPLKSEPLGLADGGSDSWAIKAPTFTVAEFSRSLDPGQSFTITWNPTSKQTSMFYRQVPATDWIDITAQPASIALTCDDPTAFFDFLFTCTDNVEQGVGTLEFVQINKQDCCSATPTAASCSTSSPPASPPSPTPPSTTPSSGDLDSCLRGTWNLNLADMQTAIQQSVAKSGVTISNLKVTGSATFAVPSTGSTATFTYTGLDISYDLDADGISASTLIDIDGTASGTVVMGTGSTFTLKNPSSKGLVKTTTTTSETGPIEIDFDLSAQYGSNVDVSYTCSATTLTMSGSQITTADGINAGTTLWAYGFTKA